MLRLTFKLSQRGQEDAIRVTSLVAHLMNFACDELVQSLKLLDTVNDILDGIGKLGCSSEVPLGTFRCAVHRFSTGFAGFAALAVPIRFAQVRTDFGSSAFQNRRR